MGNLGEDLFSCVRTLEDNATARQLALILIGKVSLAFSQWIAWLILLNCLHLTAPDL